MSVSIAAVCRKCKVILDSVGQSSLSDLERYDSWLYTDEKKTMALLNSFVQEHIMHDVLITSMGDGNPELENILRMKNFKPKKK